LTQTDITPLLNQLADRLGTTAAHLWGVLIRQAYISAAVDVVQYAVIAYVAYRLARYTNWFCGLDWEKKCEASEYTGGVLVAAWCVMALFVIIAFISIPTTIAALRNPEYWALNKVLTAMGR
jgi:hypothetical protein